MFFKIVGMTDATKKVAILQSNYIPWKGYFDLNSYIDPMGRVFYIDERFH